MDELLEERTRDGVLVVTLNRPAVLNAWTPAMEERYFDVLQEADADPATRVVVVTGAGRGFCAGADLAGSVDDLVAGGAPLPQRSERSYPPLLGTPVIAAVNGACAGVGLALALQADVRFVAADAKLTTAFTRRGLVAEHGVAWLLQRAVGRWTCCSAPACSAEPKPMPTGSQSSSSRRTGSCPLHSPTPTTSLRRVRPTPWRPSSNSWSPTTWRARSKRCSRPTGPHAPRSPGRTYWKESDHGRSGVHRGFPTTGPPERAVDRMRISYATR